MDVTVCKLPKKDGSHFFRVLIEWSADRFRITVLDEELVWCGKVSSTEVASISKQLSLTPEAYMSETRRALSTQGGATEFVYEFENERFMWKKLVVENTDIKIRFGSALMEIVPTLEMTQVTIDTIIDSNHSLKDRVIKLEEEKEHLESENQELRKKLEEFKTKKIEMEETLYSNFLDILNAKKERIRKLEAYIEQIQPEPSTSTNKTTRQFNYLDSCDESDPDDPVTKKTTATKNKKAVATKRSSSKSSSHSRSDNHELHNLSKRKQLKKSVPIISKTKTSKPDIKRKSDPVIGNNSPLDSGSVDNHYDSDTDVDPEMDEEDNPQDTSVKVTNASPKQTDDLSLDDPTSSCTLPKRIRQTAPSESTLAAAVRPAEVPVMDRDAIREFNTQQLLDELGV